MKPTKSLYDKDPNDLGFKDVTELLKQTEQTDFTDLVKLQFV